ncbi:hypothetical protein [Mesorhizobium sp. ANAO-SY3R2]|uniref:hypothetical protein n=1 Tax=Mesorhizobium sp. ANAO-SY3R2 TaxID=3166644 RepID=UPI00366EBD92
MRRYLSVLACSGLLSLGVLYGAPAIAGSIPGPISDIAPTVGIAWHGDLGGGVQLVRGGMGGGGHGGMGGGGHGGLMFPRMGGFHGMGGHGFHGMGGFHNGFHGMGGFHSGFHGHRFDHFHHFHNNNFFFGDGGDVVIGYGLPWWYSYCGPYYSSYYYGSCYPGYY